MKSETGELSAVEASCKSDVMFGEEGFERSSLSAAGIVISVATVVWEFEEASKTVSQNERGLFWVEVIAVRETTLEGKESSWAADRGRSAGRAAVAMREVIFVVMVTKNR